VLLGANFASGRTLSEGLCATVMGPEPPAALLSAAVGSMPPAVSGPGCGSSILCLFRLPLELLCWGSTG
jgi:hypothetical protein